jgi:putative transposase
VQASVRQHGIRAKGRQRLKVTTDSSHDLPIAPKLLDRQFTVAKPDRIWVAGIPSIPTDESWRLPAVVTAPSSCQMVDWSMGADMLRDIVIDALRMAWFKRHPDKQAGLISKATAAVNTPARPSETCSRTTASPHRSAGAETVGTMPAAKGWSVH